MMNEYIGDDITEKLHEEQWLTQLQATAHGGAERAAGSSSRNYSTNTGQPDLPALGPVPSVVQETSAAAKQTVASGGAAAAKLEGAVDPSDHRHHRRRLLAGVIAAVKFMLKL
jgi:hypothetical protein